MNRADTDKVARNLTRKIGEYLGMLGKSQLVEQIIAEQLNLTVIVAQMDEREACARIADEQAAWSKIENETRKASGIELDTLSAERAAAAIRARSTPQ